MARGTKDFDWRRFGCSCTKAARVLGRSGSPAMAVQLTRTGASHLQVSPFIISHFMLVTLIERGNKKIILFQF